MKRGIYLILIFVVLMPACKDNAGVEYMNCEKAKHYFAELEKACNLDNGRLWGENLYGPVVLIDVKTRKLYANTPDNRGLLKPKDGIFVGTYPKEEVITYVRNLEGTLFAMAPIPHKENEQLMVSRCIHGLFHCFQIRKNIDTPEYNNSHMSERTARLWLKMEWKALERAIRTNGNTRDQALRDALVFRSARREMYPGHIQDENHFESYEGLASFTYSYMTSENIEEYTAKVLKQCHDIYDFKSYTHSYGFVHGNLYACLLFEKGFDFSDIDTVNFDLGEKARQLYEISLPEICRDIAGSLAFNYDIDVVNSEEKVLEDLLREGLRKRTIPFTEKPVVLVELESPNFSFEEEDTDPVDTLGIIYQTIRVSDNWGKLAVDQGGCLVSANLKYLRVPAKNVASEKQHIMGDGWHIVLNNNWEMVKVEENYYIRKLLP